MLVYVQCSQVLWSFLLYACVQCDVNGGSEQIRVHSLFNEIEAERNTCFDSCKDSRSCCGHILTEEIHKLSLRERCECHRASGTASKQKKTIPLQISFI